MAQLILNTAQCYYHTHFVDEETETQRVNCPVYLVSLVLTNFLLQGVIRIKMGMEKTSYRGPHGSSGPSPMLK